MRRLLLFATWILFPLAPAAMAQQQPLPDLSQQLDSVVAGAVTLSSEVVSMRGIVLRQATTIAQSGAANAALTKKVEELTTANAALTKKIEELTAQPSKGTGDEK